MSYNYRIGQRRGPNAVIANPERLESPDGSRWACGRTVKGEAEPGHWRPVEVWTLKERVDGKVTVCGTHCDRKTAELWVNP